jgi:hypothetical protein
MIPMHKLGFRWLFCFLLLAGVARSSLQAADGSSAATDSDKTSGASATTSAQADSAYDQVMTEMSRYDQRLPGSPGYEATLDRLTSVLAAARIPVHRQIYSTLVPHTLTCSLRYGEVAIDDVHPLGPNGLALPSSWGHILSGPMVYLGDGSMAAMDGKTVRGCVAILDFATPNLSLVYSQGRKSGGAGR